MTKFSTGRALCNDKVSSQQGQRRAVTKFSTGTALCNDQVLNRDSDLQWPSSPQEQRCAVRKFSKGAALCSDRVLHRDSESRQHRGVSDLTAMRWKSGNFSSWVPAIWVQLKLYGFISVDKTQRIPKKPTGPSKYQSNVTDPRQISQDLRFKTEKQTVVCRPGVSHA